MGYGEGMDTRVTTTYAELIDQLSDPHASPLITAFRARRQVAGTWVMVVVAWLVLVPILSSLLMPNMSDLPGYVISSVVATVVAIFATSTTRHVLGLRQDGSVTIARVGLLGSQKIDDVTMLYPPGAPFQVESKTPLWRTQRIMIAGDTWYPTSATFRFRPQASDRMPELV